MPTISIIVPVYNTEKYLHRCIDSILAQTFTDFELLLIDDGSTDRSGEICDEYVAKDNRVRVFHKENGGVSSARNLGLDNAIGEWITFADSDDKVYSNWLQIYEKCNFEADLICQGMEFDHSLMKNYKIKNCIVGFDYKGNIANGLLLLHKYGLRGTLCAKLFRRSIIVYNKLRLDERFCYREDEDFVLKYMTYCIKMISCGEAGYYYYYLSIEHLGKYRNGLKCNMFELFVSLLKSALRINGDRNSEITIFYADELTMALMDAFKFSVQYDKMKIYRELLGDLVLKTRLMRLTKWFIYIDVTMVLSSLIFYLHTQLKEFICFIK